MNGRRQVGRIVEQLGDQARPIAVDGDVAVEALLDLDPGASRTAARLRRYVEEVALEADGVVSSHHAAVLGAEVLLESTVRGPGNPGGLGIERWDDEAAVVRSGSMSTRTSWASIRVEARANRSSLVRRS